MRVALALFFAFLLTACAGASNSPENRLATTEAAFTAAVEQVGTLRREGIIKPGTKTATIVAQAIQAGSSALDVWQSSPKNPDYVAAGVAAVNQLVKLVEKLRAGRSIEARVVKPFGFTCSTNNHTRCAYG